MILVCLLLLPVLGTLAEDVCDSTKLAFCDQYDTQFGLLDNTNATEHKAICDATVEFYGCVVRAGCYAGEYTISCSAMVKQLEQKHIHCTTTLNCEGPVVPERVLQDTAEKEGHWFEMMALSLGISSATASWHEGPQGREYFRVDVALDFWQAKKKCAELGGALPEIHTREEVDFLMNFIKDPAPVWVNLHNPEVGDSSGWKWSDGSTPKTDLWPEGFPMSSQRRWGCGSVYVKGITHRHCNYPETTVCVKGVYSADELPPTTAATGSGGEGVGRGGGGETLPSGQCVTMEAQTEEGNWAPIMVDSLSFSWQLKPQRILQFATTQQATTQFVAIPLPDNQFGLLESSQAVGLASKKFLDLFIQSAKFGATMGLQTAVDIFLAPALPLLLPAQGAAVVQFILEGGPLASIIDVINHALTGAQMIKKVSKVQRVAVLPFEGKDALEPMQVMDLEGESLPLFDSDGNVVEHNNVYIRLSRTRGYFEKILVFSRFSKAHHASAGTCDPSILFGWWQASNPVISLGSGEPGKPLKIRIKKCENVVSTKDEL